MINYKNLIDEAFAARKKSYAPYSNFNVGVALQCDNNIIYHGCNIESASQTPSCCGERTAFFKAISEGEKDFKAIAIVAAPKDATAEDFEICAPCGVCRQVMAEFCDGEQFEIILAKSNEEYDVYSLNELLPLSFTGKDINK